jgi:DNA-binding MarR family transcriptional regulator
MDPALHNADAATRAWALMFDFFEVERPHMLARIEALGLSPIEIGLLKDIGERGPIPMGDLILARFHDRSSITRFVDRLVRRGWVDRREHPDDRRIRVVSLTPEGAASRADILRRMSVPPPSIQSLSTADQERMVELFTAAITAARSRTTTA